MATECQWTEDVLNRITGGWRNICTWDEDTVPGLNLDYDSHNSDDLESSAFKNQLICIWGHKRGDMFNLFIGKSHSYPNPGYVTLKES